MGKSEGCCGRVVLGTGFQRFFFSPIPCTHTSLPLDGMARNCYYFIYMDTQDHAIYHVWIHFIPTCLYPRREKTIWSELESNPGPLVSVSSIMKSMVLVVKPRANEGLDASHIQAKGCKEVRACL